MQKISNRVSIDELYRYRTECGELQCHRINLPEGMAGELIINVPLNEKTLSIEEVFVDRKFRNTGLGTTLLDFAENTGRTLGFQRVEVRPFSIDPLVPDNKLQEWYKKRGYVPVGEKMSKRIIVKNQTIQTVFADFALFAVKKIMHRKGRKERKVFRICKNYVLDYNTEKVIS